MMLHYDLYWSFRSPYSYLVAKRLVDLEREFDVTCHVRVVYPIAVRTPEFFEKNDPLWQQYFVVDVFRVAQYLDIPLRWPRPDPVYRDMATGKYPKEQPHIHRLSQLGVVATQRGCGLAFVDEVSRTIWSGAVDNWHQGDHLAQAAQRAGLDLAEMDAEVAKNAESLDAIIVANQEAQRRGGHYGVPLMVFDGEPFFGQDRFDLMKWRMQQKGLARRTV